LEPGGYGNGSCINQARPFVNLDREIPYGMGHRDSASTLVAQAPVFALGRRNLCACSAARPDRSKVGEDEPDGRRCCSLCGVYRTSFSALMPTPASFYHTVPIGRRGLALSHGARPGRRGWRCGVSRDAIHLRAAVWDLVPDAETPVPSSSSRKFGNEVRFLRERGNVDRNSLADAAFYVWR